MGSVSLFTMAVLSLFIPTVLTFIYAYRAKAQLFEYPDLKGRAFLKLGLILNLFTIDLLIFAIVVSAFPLDLLPGLVALILPILGSVLFMYIYNNK